MIHVIGDSHVMEFDRDGFSLHLIGPATAYGLMNPYSRTKSKERVFEILSKVTIDSPIILSFGEIDCRLHIYKQPDKIVDRIWHSIRNLLYFSKEIKQKGFQVYLYNVNPGTWEQNIYKVNPFPSFEERALIYLIFNSVLYMSGPTGKIINIYSRLRDKNSMLDKRFTDDGVHINKEASDLFLFPEVERVMGRG